MNEIEVPCVRGHGFVPEYQSEGSSGADVRADVEGEIMIEPGARVAVPTGLKLEIPPGFEAQIRPRSGLALRHGVSVLNTPGTIDSDYRGELHIILVNLGTQPFVVRRGDRIAQIVFVATARARFVVQEVIADSTRGEGGFGSTGL